MKYLITDPTNISMKHLDQERKKIQLTKIVMDSTKCTYNIMSTIVPFLAKEMSYGDLTGSFPYTSSRGNRYFYVMYDHDSNAILVARLKNHTATSIVEAWKQLFNKMTKHGHETKMFILDNEFSGQLKTTLSSHHLKYQLVPPHVHCQNAAERAIKTFKTHFLSVLATADSNFPITEWDRLLPQAEMTLNLLHPARYNPKLSSHSYLNGLHNFPQTPLAPAGTKVTIHMKLQNRASWDYHGKTGWYVGPAPDHYRCFRCFIPSTSREIITDTLRFITNKIRFPNTTIETTLQKSIDKIVNILQNKSITNLVYNLPKNTIIFSFKHISTLLNNNPKMFTPHKGLPPTTVPSNGPRT